METPWRAVGAWWWETKATRQQVGYVDCGVHLCVNLRAVAEAAPSTPWTEGDPVRLRHGVVTELHNKRLWGYTGDNGPRTWRPPTTTVPSQDYIVVIDVECTLDEEGRGVNAREIIEWPAILMDRRDRRTVAEFHASRSSGNCTGCGTTKESASSTR
jgi:hypothetical protein